MFRARLNTRLATAAVFLLLSIWVEAGETAWNGYMVSGVEAYQAGQFEVAKTQFEAALERTTDFDVHDPRISATLNELALLSQAQGFYAEAQELLERSLENLERTHESTALELAHTLNKLASVDVAQGRYVEAELLFNRALSNATSAYGAGHPEVAVSLSNLAGLYAAQRDFRRAEQHYQRAMTIFTDAFGEEHMLPRYKTT